MVYFDNAATTLVLPKYNQIIEKYNNELYYNPASLTAVSSGVAKHIKQAKAEILKQLSGSVGNLVFTASGTEAINIAMFAKTFKAGSKILIGAAEHSAVYNSAQFLKQKGCQVVLCPVDRFGVVEIDELDSLVDKNTALAAIMHVNNETGAINDISQIVSLIRQKNPSCLVLCDGVQAFKKIPVDVAKLGVDFYAISGHKIHAPKGIGALYMKKGVAIKTFVFGGGQEDNIRSGTQNVSGIMAFAEAASEDFDVGSKSSDTVSGDKCDISARGHSDLICCLSGFLKDNFDCIINTPEINSGYILSVAFKGSKGEVLQRKLEMLKVIVGTGSACSSKKGGYRIADALALPKDYRDGIIRISMSRYTSEEDIQILKEGLLAIKQ